MSGPITMTQEDGIARLVLDRPEVFNAFDDDMVECFARHVVMLAVDDSVRGVVI